MTTTPRYKGGTKEHNPRLGVVCLLTIGGLIRVRPRLTIKCTGANVRRTWWEGTPLAPSCNDLQTRSLGLASKGGFEPTIRANTKGCEPTLAANELILIAINSQTVTRTHIYCIQNREDVTVREK